MLASGSRCSLKHARLPTFKALEREANRALRQYATSSRPSSLKSQPWNFDRDASFQKTQTRGDLASYNVNLAEQARQGRFLAVLDIAKSMKDAGVRPDVSTYTYMTQALAQGRLHAEIRAVIEDMVRMGIKPTRTHLTHLVESQSQLDYSRVAKSIEDMEKLGVEPGAETYAVIIGRFVQDRNLELALQFWHVMKDRGFVPELKTMEGLITLAAKSELPRLALDLAMAFEAESVRRLGHEVWMQCLVSSAEELYADGVCHCWQVAVQDMKITPDEGLCQAVLHTAARHGLPDLATDALRVLKIIGVQWQEHHFAPLIEAFSRADRLKEAISTFDIMRKNGVVPNLRTALSIVDAIGQDTDKLDGIWTLMDEAQKEGKAIDLCALNAILKVCVKLGDLQRAIGAYKAFTEYNVKPDLDTFDLLLESCVLAGHRELGDKILTDMKQAQVRPGPKTYECMTLLCLTQDTYEDAFYYLEETKSSGFTPTYNVYDSLVRKCASCHDPRMDIALEEMRQVGYEPSHELNDYLVQMKEARRASEMAHLSGAGLDGAAQRFIETGGLDGRV